MNINNSNQEIYNLLNKDRYLRKKGHINQLNETKETQINIKTNIIVVIMVIKYDSNKQIKSLVGDIEGENAGGGK